MIANIVGHNELKGRNVAKGTKKRGLLPRKEENPGNVQQGRQQGSNTGKEGAKSNVKLQTRNEPWIPKTSGVEKKEQKNDFQPRR